MVNSCWYRLLRVGAVPTERTFRLAGDDEAWSASACLGCIFVSRDCPITLRQGRVHLFSFHDDICLPVPFCRSLNLLSLRMLVFLMGGLLTTQLELRSTLPLSLYCFDELLHM